MSEIAERASTAPVVSSSPLDAVIQIATSGQEINMDVLRGLMDMRKEMQAEEARIAFNDAMARAQGKMPIIPKDAKGQSGKFSSREQILKLIQPIYTAEGLAVHFDEEPTDLGVMRYWCVISHRAGHVERVHMDLARDDSGNKNVVQASGSSSAYAMRYLLARVFTLAFEEDPDDDDGGKAAKAEADLLGYNALVREHIEFIAKVKFHIEAEDWPEVAKALDAQAHDDSVAGFESEATLRSLWRATDKGGIFETAERLAIKSEPVTKERLGG